MPALYRPYASSLTTGCPRFPPYSGCGGAITAPRPAPFCQTPSSTESAGRHGDGDHLFLPRHRPRGYTTARAQLSARARPRAAARPRRAPGSDSSRARRLGRVGPARVPKPFRSSPAASAASSTRGRSARAACARGTARLRARMRSTDPTPPGRRRASVPGSPSPGAAAPGGSSASSSSSSTRLAVARSVSKRRSRRRGGEVLGADTRERRAEDRLRAQGGKDLAERGGRAPGHRARASRATATRK